MLRAVEMQPGKIGPSKVIVILPLDILTDSGIKIESMQEQSLRLAKCTLGALPVIDQFIKRLGIEALLKAALKRISYVRAVILLVKSILERPAALYRLREWAQGYEPQLVGGGAIGDDTIGRALDRLFVADRASLLTKLVLNALGGFGVATDEIHNDSTSVSFCGAYNRQNEHAVQLRHGHSKDHRPDLKQLVYSLSIAADGAVPLHFTTYDGNITDDTTHWETWQTLRGLLGKSDFVYVADCKLCVAETLRKIDRAQGKFITILPRNRKEVAAFESEVLASTVRWNKLWSKRSSRKRRRRDVFELAAGIAQMQEGFRIFWYRSSEKMRRDAQERAELMSAALAKLRALDHQKRARPKTEVGMQHAAERILDTYRVQDWITVSVSMETQERFRQTTRGKPTPNTQYRRIEKHRPVLRIAKNLTGIARAAALDGIFPLVSNAQLSALDVLKKYKYQPMLEKRHALFKSVLEVAPVFLKKNERIEALMFVYFIAQMLAALIEREVRHEMKTRAIPSLAILPEGRASKNPSATQILSSFAGLARYHLTERNDPLKTFADKLSPLQVQLLSLLKIEQTTFA